MSGGVIPPDQRVEHRAGGALTPLHDTVDRVLRLSTADACVVIARKVSSVNLRWAHNTVTTNGDADEVQLSVMSIIGRRVASITRTYFPDDHLEDIVRESETAARKRPEAPDFVPLLGADGQPADWSDPPPEADVRIFDPFVLQLRPFYEAARREGIATFGYSEMQTATTLVATSAGLRRRYSDRLGKVEITAKSPDYSRSSWVGRVTHDFGDIELEAMLGDLRRRLEWSRTRIDMPAGSYEVLLEPSCTADLAIAAYWFMTRRDADEGRSPYSKPGGGTRIGERIFGDVTLYSDPAEPGIEAAPFVYGAESGGPLSVFDNGLNLTRIEWTRDGVLQHLITPRFWSAKMGLDGAHPYIPNLIVEGKGSQMSQLIARTDRALLVTCFWYIRTVDPQTALVTGLTRDGVFLVEHGEVKGAVNNFRWNMSPIAALAQATEIGQSGLALPREADEFLRAKAPALRIERFNMSSVSEAS